MCRNHSSTGLSCLVMVAKLWLDNCSLDGGFRGRSIFPLFKTRTMALLSECIWGEELNLVSKVRTLNMKMLDHLLEIRDNPVRLQLLEASCVGWICCLFCGSSIFFPSLFLFFAAPKHKDTQKECWSRELATLLCLLLCTVTHFIILTPMWR